MLKKKIKQKQNKNAAKRTGHVAFWFELPPMKLPCLSNAKPPTLTLPTSRAEWRMFYVLWVVFLEFVCFCFTKRPWSSCIMHLGPVLVLCGIGIRKKQTKVISINGIGHGHVLVLCGIGMWQTQQCMPWFNSTHHVRSQECKSEEIEPCFVLFWCCWVYFLWNG